MASWLAAGFQALRVSFVCTIIACIQSDLRCLKTRRPVDAPALGLAFTGDLRRPSWVFLFRLVSTLNFCLEVFFRSMSLHSIFIFWLLFHVFAHTFLGSFYPPSFSVGLLHAPIYVLTGMCLFCGHVGACVGVFDPHSPSRAPELQIGRVCVGGNALTWPGASFWGYAFPDLRLESVCVCVCVYRTR